MIEIGTYSFTYIQLTIAGVLFSTLVVQLFYYLYFYLRVFFIPKVDVSKADFPVSVVICAHNEQEGLSEFLPKVLKQKYKEFQVVVVDDCSDDDTGYVLAKFKEEYPHLYFTQIAKDTTPHHSKKMALMVGMKAAKYEHVVHIDADCYPVSENWLAEVANSFLDTTGFVLGYGGYEQRKGILNYFIRFDTAFIGLQYLTFAKAGVPYMGVGRNLAYKQEVFWKNKGFGKFNRMISGDDDLLVNQCATSQNTVVCVSETSKTVSVPNTSWSDWSQQKRRHSTTSPYYKPLHRFLLTLEPLSRVLFYFSLFATFYFFPTFVYYTVGIYFIRAVLQLVIVNKAFKVFNEKYLVGGFLFLDLLLPFVYIWLLKPQKKKTPKLNSWM